MRHMEGGADGGPEFIEKKEQAEAAFWRLKRAADRRREDRVKSVLAQEGEPISYTLGRSLYISLCILFDGLILTEVIFLTGKTGLSWAIFGVLLGFAVMFQKELYERWFSIDISQIEFEEK